MTYQLIATILLAILSFWGGLPPQTDANTPLAFSDRTENYGITFRHTDGRTGQKYFIEPLGAGVALFDYDNDGDLDCYFVNACPLTDVALSPWPVNALYRNDGDRFTDITAQANVGHPGYGFGCCVGDYDNDGWDDLFVTNFGANVLYHNNGDGTFADVTSQAGLDAEDLSTGCAFADYDNDGWLDLYVASYATFDLDNNLICSHQGVQTYCTPEVYPGATDRLYRNRGDGTFEEVTKAAGVLNMGGKGLGVVWGDYDNDGLLDIFVANDTTPNLLYHNNGDGTFEEVGLFAGVGYSEEGRAYSGMGANMGDLDNDGHLDIIVTNFQDQTNSLYHNDGDGFFTEISFRVGLGQQSLPYLAWGTDFVDFDRDGWQDIFIANGHLDDNIEAFDPVGTYAQPNFIFLNHFGEKLSVHPVPNPPMPKVSRGCAFGDLDNDGDVDVVVSNLNDTPTILTNETANGNHWLSLELVGVESNRSAIGTRATVTVGDQTQIREVKSGSGYLSQNDRRLYFGLGRTNTVDQLRIRWPNGDVQVFENIPADQFLRVLQGQSPEAVNRISH